MTTAAVVALLAELGAHTPVLPRAACRGRTDLFDRDDTEGIAAAKDICRYCCPELAACEAWAATVSPHKLFGVIAGHRYSPNHKKGRTMTDHTADPVEIPRDTVIVTPNAEPLYIYQEVNGHQLISVKITDNRVDDVQLMLTPEVARHMALNMLAMLDNLDQLHTQWTDTHHD